MSDGTRILGGSIKENKMLVNSDGRALGQSIIETESESATFDGNAYNINTGTINVSVATQAALWYLKNTTEDQYVITAFFYLLGASNGSGDSHVDILRNPTGGTLTSSGTQFEPVNRHFGSNNVFTTTNLYGDGTALTLTGQDDIAIESVFSSVGRKTLSVGAVILDPNNSIGVRLTAPSGNTSMDVQIACAIYKRTNVLA